jgi:hypothetical protein
MSGGHSPLESATKQPTYSKNSGLQHTRIIASLSDAGLTKKTSSSSRSIPPSRPVASSAPPHSHASALPHHLLRGGSTWVSGDLVTVLRQLRDGPGTREWETGGEDADGNDSVKAHDDEPPR